MADRSTICAICTAVIVGEVRREPLGKGGALVNVCDECADEPAREVRGPERGYEGAGSHLSNKEITGAMVRVMGQEAYDRDMRFAQKIDVSSTFVVRDGVRVKRSDAELEKMRKNRAALHDIDRMNAEGVRLNRTGAIAKNDRWRRTSALNTGKVSARRIRNPHVMLCKTLNEKIGWREYRTMCSCGWRSKRVNSKARAYKLGKEHAPEGVFK